MPATTKTELLTATDREYAKLTRLIADLSETDALMPDDDDTSIKDVIGHRAHWIELLLGWYADGQAGKQVAFPAPGYKWNQLKAYNADLRAAQKNLTWDDTREMLYENHHRLTRFLSALSDAELYGGPMKGGENHWTTGRWAEAAGASHYRSAGKYIRKTLKSRKR
ncbi:ClbS/DfsB family four-helix bundle protein [uncultured Hoeflea sp.]|uniref:ClbS/DfsB family four-helix bundle protein n=1 Tax=uncultured Hoeflea sp. TaxID=538666 RepID=UPI002634822C|nr:ClbS/DfsB family four-helix bundle protein [uncultured Hoeflea sp.]